MCNIADVNYNDILSVLDKYTECKINDGNYVRFNTSSTNLIIRLDEKYVLKKKKAIMNVWIDEWYESVFLKLKEENICEIYIPNTEKKIFEYKSGYRYCIMNYYAGINFEFGNSKHITSVIAFINQLQKIVVPTEMILNDELLLKMPKQEIHKWYISRDCFERQYIKKMQLLSIELDVNIELILALISDIDKSELRFDYDCLQKSFSHGEIQGQNLIFDKSGSCKVVDWDSISIRPRIYDIAMSSCFLCRAGRGNFIINCDLMDSYVDKFELTDIERKYLPVFRQIAFLPDLDLLEEYYSFNPLKAKWYLEWSIEALKNIK